MAKLLDKNKNNIALEKTKQNIDTHARTKQYIGEMETLLATKLEY